MWICIFLFAVLAVILWDRFWNEGVITWFPRATPIRWCVTHNADTRRYRLKYRHPMGLLWNDAAGLHGWCPFSSVTEFSTLPEAKAASIELEQELKKDRSSLEVWKS